MLVQRRVYLYVLVDPAWPAHVRYVGVAIDPVNRLSVHLTTGAERSHRAAWIRLVQQAGRRPIMRIVMIADSYKYALLMESRLIALYRSRGHRLTNVLAYGSDKTGVPVSQETRARISAATKHPKSEAGRQNIAKGIREHWADPAWAASRRESLRVAALRQFATIEARQKNSAGQRRRFASLEGKRQAKEAAQLRESRLTIEQRERIRIARIAQWRDPDSLTRQSARSSERSEKLRQVALARWANPAHRATLSKEMRRRWSEPGFRNKQVASARRLANDPIIRANRSEVMKKVWADRRIAGGDSA